ncbi:heavy-metal-associated domain-containing protein [Sporosarcina gallistercoris]|uniref:Heavy-metal-associated domain-containing protein n=1 Tax=Sporosarcina gallistercoris TaxID=2762245 RepID=A0ABR8PIP5_9BACL|nr:heavy-metal-associated domain-containing protein [Sporosarcina gallistercoris]MBD7908031.1 heavy-metal-associated domain-containing protein [Sporosarcina gallistercoris]
MKKGVFTLEPLSCPSCIKKIEGALKKMNGVKEVNVLFNSSKVRTQFDEELVTAEEIQHTIVKLGYPVLAQKVS